MSKIDQLRNIYAEMADCVDSVVEVVDAPKDAQTFDKMLVVLVKVENNVSNRKIIRRVILYNSVTDSIIGQY